MSNDVERFINLIYITKVMGDLRTTNFSDFLKCVEQTQDWNKYEDIYEIVKIDNVYINNAIQELIFNKTFLKILKEEINIDIDKIKHILDIN